jgi:hypothetical protein
MGTDPIREFDEFTAALPEHRFPLLQAREAAVGEHLVAPRPDPLRRLQFLRSRAAVDPA